MKNVGVIYWSGTGNTEEMAKYVVEGVENGGGKATLFLPNEFNSSLIDTFDSLAFGCPSMGAEQLEESEFEPMFNDCLNSLNGKRIALFGSYGWGVGEWMELWEETCNSAGANITHNSVICSGAADEQTKDDCKSLGASLL